MHTSSQHIINLGRSWTFLSLAAIGIGCLIYAVRFSGSEMPEFLLYNLPDALWAFGFAGLLLSLSQLSRPYIWIAALTVMGITGEILQDLQIIPGTFDYLDIACYLGGTAIAILGHLFLHYKTMKP